MVFVDDKDYMETLEILRGERELPQVFKELKKWMKEKYNVTAYNFIFREFEFNNPKHKFRLFILLSNADDCRRMFKGYNYDEREQKEISQKFYELALENNFDKLDNAKDIFVSYNDFSEELAMDINDRTCQAVGKGLCDKYKLNSIWEIHAAFSRVTVFYQADEDVRVNWENGISNAIRSEYFAELHRQDEFHILTDDRIVMDFDSKENLDKNFMGSLYYYFL